MGRDRLAGAQQVLAPGLGDEQRLEAGAQGGQPLAGRDERRDLVRATGPGRIRHGHAPQIGGPPHALGRLDEPQKCPGIRRRLGAERPGRRRRSGNQRVERAQGLGDEPLEGLELGRQQRRSPGAGIGVGVEGPHRGQVLLQLAHDRLTALEARRVPFTDAGDGQPRQRLAADRPADPQQLAEGLVRREAALADRRVDGLAIAVQALAQLVHQGELRRQIAAHARPAELHGALQLAQERLLVGLVAVQLQAGVAQADGVQAPLHHLQSGHLLRDEKHLLARPDGLGDHVGDGLALARAGRPLNDQVAAALHIEHGEHLRAVRIHHGGQIQRPQVPVEVVLVIDGRAGLREAVLQERANQRVLGRLGAVLPGLAVEVPVHQELAEGEKPQGDRIRLHPPAALPGDGGCHLLEVGRHIEVFRRGQGRQHQAELAFQLGPEREVVTELLLAIAQREALRRARSAELDGHEHQGRPARLAGALRVVPAQHTERQVQDVHALLLDEGAGAVIGVEQDRLQPLGRQRRLQPGVLVPGGRLGGLAHRRRLCEARLLGGVGRRREGHGLALGNQDAEDLHRLLIHHVDAARARRTVVEQRVAQPEIEQLFAGGLELRLHGIEGIQHGGSLSWTVADRGRNPPAPFSRLFAGESSQIAIRHLAARHAPIDSKTHPRPDADWLMSGAAPPPT
ncbi:hypothetical protein D3C72_975710 [compost metagenome]